MWGADAGQLVALAVRLEGQAEEIDRAQRALTGRLRSAPWQGPGADRYRQRWESVDRRRVMAAAGFLRDSARELRANAAQQQQASAGASGQIGAGGAGLDAAVPRPEPLGAGVAATSLDYAEQITRLEPGEIALRKVDDGPPPRFVLMLRGLDIGSATHNGFAGTVQDFAASDSPYQQKLRIMLGSLPDDAEIGVLGHSQGGMAALALANADTRVKDVIVFGSPIDQMDVPSHARVTAVYNEADRVPKADDAFWSLDLSGNSLMHALHGQSKVPTAVFADPQSGSIITGDHGMRQHYIPALRNAGDGSGTVTWRTGEGNLHAHLTVFDSRYSGGAASGKVHVIDAG